ncbi:MAG: alpha/beta fold hydrolase [Planctomycetota bacterium]|nr:alpha/beta fold hydrolase [Planctomycetota bacterium]
MTEAIRPFVLEHADKSGEPGRLIRGRVVAPAGAETAAERLPAVLVLHGFKGFMDWGFFPEFARRVAGRGLAAVAFNMSGSGIGEDLERFTEDEAFARDTWSRQLEDVERVRAAVAAMPWIDPERMALVGHSRGGAVALLHAAERGDYRAVVTWAAVASVDPYDPGLKAEWRERGHVLIHNARTGQDHRVDVGFLEDLERNAARLDVLAACRRLATPTLLLHGTADESVPFAAAQALGDALPSVTGRVLAVEGGGHTFGAGHPFEGSPPELELVWDETLTWLREHLGPAG